MAREQRVAEHLPAQSADCQSSGCASLEARDLTTPQRVLLELLLKLPLLPALLWLLPLILLWGLIRPPLPSLYLPGRPPPPLRFRVLQI